MIKSVLVFVFVVTSVIFSPELMAQFGNGGGVPGGGTTPGGGGSGGGIPGTGGGPVVPFDGGMSLMLLASGIGYGVDRLKVNKYKLPHSKCQE